MTIEPVGVYNEPTPRRASDRTPERRTSAPVRVGRVVRARLELERQLRICANPPTIEPPRVTEAHRRVLVAMLSETDSPLSASLRARAAGLAGGLRLREAAPALRKMALDEEEDLQTRLNAVDSYLRIRGFRAAGDLPALLKADEALVRAAVLVAALESDDVRLVQLAEAKLRHEKDPRVRRRTERRVPGYRAEPGTIADEAAKRKGR